MTKPGLLARWTIANAFLRTRRLTKRLRTREDIDRWQEKRLRHFLAKIAPRVEAYANLAGRPLSDYPITDKAEMMGAFHSYNRFGIGADAAWQALETSERLHGCAVGASTGTSGNRGLYLISDKERYEWLGVILAKALPDIRDARHRVSVILPTNSSLYDAANESGRLVLKFHDLNEGIAAHIARIAAFKPTAIVAPPKVLRLLAEADIDLAPKQIFSGAEVLDPLDREVIEARFGLIVQEIYMATEGLFAVACPHGTLHLAEDAVKFEWDTDLAPGNLAAPIVTDFTRRTQMMIRYRMNDLLELSDTPCACGSPLQAVSAIAGRMDDIFKLAGPYGHEVLITPDIIRNAVIDADRRITDFRVVQTGANAVELTLPLGFDDAAMNAKIALRSLFTRLDAEPDISASTRELIPPEDHKLRRVRREIEDEH